MRVIAIILVAAVLLLFLTGLVASQSDSLYGLLWWSVDGGGTSSITADGYELSGTIGQPDAGVMTGGDYTIGGGLWSDITTEINNQTFLPFLLRSS